MSYYGHGWIHGAVPVNTLISQAEADAAKRRCALKRKFRRLVGNSAPNLLAAILAMNEAALRELYSTLHYVSITRNFP